jgi:hypothetical protein
MVKDGFKAGEGIEQNLFNLSAKEKRKYLFLKQIATLNSFKERNAISREQYDISYNGLISKMEITEWELTEWLSDNL